MSFSDIEDDDVGDDSNSNPFANPGQTPAPYHFGANVFGPDRGPKPTRLRGQSSTTHASVASASSTNSNTNKPGSVPPRAAANAAGTVPPAPAALRGGSRIRPAVRAGRRRPATGIRAGRTREQIEKLKEELADLRKQMMPEWKTNDYIPEEDINRLSSDALVAAHLVAGENPTAEDLAERAKDALEDSEEAARLEADPNSLRMGFEALIAKKREQMMSSVGGRAERVNNTEAPACSPVKAVASHGPMPDNYKSLTNIIHIEDPDATLRPDTADGLKPQMDLKNPLNMDPQSFRAHSADFFISDRSALERSASVRNIEQHLNRFQLLRDTAQEPRYSEKDIISPTSGFMSDMARCTAQSQGVHRGVSYLCLMFFVEHPLFLLCMFERDRRAERKLKPDEEIGTDAELRRRRYRWAGHRYTIGVEPPKPPPSNLPDEEELLCQVKG